MAQQSVDLLKRRQHFLRSVQFYKRLVNRRSRAARVEDRRTIAGIAGNPARLKADSVLRQPVFRTQKAPRFHGLAHPRRCSARRSFLRTALPVELGLSLYFRKRELMHFDLAWLFEFNFHAGAGSVQLLLISRVRHDAGRLSIFEPATDAVIPRL